MQIQISSIEQIGQAARIFADNIGSRRVFAFYGSMGAGKTTFIKAVCELLGVTDAVASPTFAIVNEYMAGEVGSVYPELSRQPIYHFDFYRIKSIGEAYDLGFEDYAYSGRLCLMEWPELIEPLLPEETVSVTITEQSDGSRLVDIAE